ncbi:MAG: TPM domain-containing protein, partial [Candidatus Acidiferrales bacterium]
MALVLGATAAAQNPKDLRPQGYVSDFAHVISPDTKAALDTLCQELDKKAGAQIAIVTVRSLEHESIEEYSIDLATRWGIGPKQKDRGVLILVAPRQRRYRIEVGYGLEPILPDGLVGDFGRQAVPQLRIGNYSGAILLLTENVATVVAKDRGVTLAALSQDGQSPMGAETPPPPPTPQNVTLRILPVLLLLFFPLLGLLLRMRAGRRYGRGHG